jgi:hypothetical protein
MSFVDTRNMVTDMPADNDVQLQSFDLLPAAARCLGRTDMASLEDIHTEDYSTGVHTLKHTGKHLKLSNNSEGCSHTRLGARLTPAGGTCQRSPSVDVCNSGNNELRVCRCKCPYRHRSDEAGLSRSTKEMSRKGRAVNLPARVCTPTAPTRPFCLPEARCAR